MTLSTCPRSQTRLRVLRCGNVAELYLAASAAPREMDAVFVQIAAALSQHNAHIMQERLFAPAELMNPALQARRNAYGWLDDVLPPAVLQVEDATVGVQVHAIAGAGSPAIIGGTARHLHCRGVHYLTGTGLHAPHLSEPAQQAQAVFEQAQRLLAGAGADFHNVARTWIWMDDILAWYGDLNRVRTSFFQTCGLLDAPGLLPASTGIGIAPRVGQVSLDFLAAWGETDLVQRFHAAGNQKSAFNYGSAFARAARVRTPAGQTIFVSGTAAIDTAGKTCCADDPAGQVRMTIENVRAVLQSLHCDDADVVQAIAYCATPQVRQYIDDLPWPCLVLPGTVCRPDLLFEVEATACPGARALQ